MQIKLIAVSMLSLFAVLSLIVGISITISYFHVIMEADDILSVLAENDGHFPNSWKHMEHMEKNDVFQAELPYESRYFSVTFTEGDVCDLIDVGQIAAIDSDTAVQYATDVQKSGKEYGFVGNYRYQVNDTEEGTRVTFLDCRRSLSNFREFCITITQVAIAGFILVFLLIIYFSRWIVNPAVESYEKQKLFITDAGHELKTPLAIIDADADVLSMDVGDSEWLTDIKKQVRRMTSLTNDLICLARMEEADRNMEMITFPISEIVEETASSFQAPAKTQKKEFILDIAPALSMTGDEKMIRQLTSILLDNALKYSPEGGTIRVSLKKQNRQIRLSVYNTAISVDPSELAHLFDRFYRSDRSRNSATGGYGIGLAIAKAIVSTHRGRIQAATADEKSLTIEAVLPG